MDLTVTKHTATHGLMTLQSRIKINTVLLVDLSGSMGGTKIQDVQKCLQTLWRPGMKCIGFNSNLWDIAKKDIAHLATSGSTYVLPALRAAWDLDPKRIILLTDGQPSDPEYAIIEAVRAHPRLPIDTIGFADEHSASYSPDFLRQISTLTGGRFNEAAVGGAGGQYLLTDCLADLLMLAETTTTNHLFNL